MAVAGEQPLAHPIVWVDGSTQHGVALGASAVVTDGFREMVHYTGSRGHFVGSATAELIALLLGLNAGRGLRQYTLCLDSAVVLSYMNGHQPTTLEGMRLMPLIEVARLELARAGGRVRLLQVPRSQNRAHASALRAMRGARDKDPMAVELFSALGVHVYDALARVERASRGLGG